MRGYGCRVMTESGAGRLWRAVGRALWGAGPGPVRLGGRWMSPYLAGLLWLTFCASMFAGAVGQMYGAQGFALGVAYGLGIVQVLPLVAAPWFPLVAWRVSVVGMILGIPAAMVAGAGWAWPATSCVAYGVIVLIVALRTEDPVGAAVGLLTFVVLSVPAFLLLSQPSIGMVGSAAVIAAVVTGGAELRRRTTAAAREPVAPPYEDRAERTGPAAVPVLGPIAAALLLARDRPRDLVMRSRPRRVTVLVLSVLFGGGMFGGAVGQMYGSHQMGFSLGIAFGLGALQALPLIAAPWYPLLAWRVSTVGLVLGVLTYPPGPASLPYPAGPGPGWPWPATSCIAYLMVLLLVALRHDRQVVAGVGLVVVLGGVPLLWLGHHASAPSVLLAVAFTLTVLVLGDNVRARRAAQAGLAEQAELRRQDLARQAVLEERSRIARELHDVVAHHMSMIAIQAEAAPYKIPGLPDEALRTFTAIRGASTRALTEMRRVIGLLRDDGDAAERLPQPGLDLLDDLVAGARDAGMIVRTVVTGTPRDLPAGVDVSAYRIVQEALSNAGRHAPGAAVTVTLAYDARALRIRVADDGVVTGEPGDPGNGGHGLVGMRERVAMLGGTLHAGPADEGGFAVTAELPVGENDEP